MREPGPRVPHLGTGSVAARVGFEPTEVALGRFQGGCTRPLCDLANRARPGGPILAIIHRAYFIVPDLDPLIPRLDVDESERGHRPVTLNSGPWTTAITRFALSRQHLSAITVFRVV